MEIFIFILFINVCILENKQFYSTSKLVVDSDFNLQRPDFDRLPSLSYHHHLCPLNAGFPMEFGGRGVEVWNGGG